MADHFASPSAAGGRLFLATGSSVTAYEIAKLASHWMINRVLIKEGNRVPVITWGTLELKSAMGPVRCRTVGAGWIENPKGGATGIAATEAFIPFFLPCEAPGCPGEIKVIGEGLATMVPGTTFLAPESLWPSELFREGETIRDKSGLTKASPTKAVKLRIQCNVGTQDTVNTVFAGELQPRLINAISAAKPAFAEFGAGSGGLVSPEFGASETLGKDNVMGYEQQEIITAE